MSTVDCGNKQPAWLRSTIGEVRLNRLYRQHLTKIAAVIILPGIVKVYRRIEKLVRLYIILKNLAARQYKFRFCKSGCCRPQRSNRSKTRFSDFIAITS